MRISEYLRSAKANGRWNRYPDELTVKLLMLTVFAQIGLPVIFTVIMAGMESLLKPANGWRERWTKVGWDLCVLALALGSGVFAHRTDARHAPDLDTASVATALAASLGAAILIAFTRRRQGQITGLHAALCLILGGVTLGLPIYYIQALG